MSFLEQNILNETTDPSRKEQRHSLHPDDPVTPVSFRSSTSPPGSLSAQRIVPGCWASTPTQPALEAAENRPFCLRRARPWGCSVPPGLLLAGLSGKLPGSAHGARSAAPPGPPGLPGLPEPGDAQQLLPPHTPASYSL